ncbi:exodeoxyribonuclease VII large subunit [Endozoicomonas arenosclerae]|uniref:exodeoxyribonuclease VII large subunit n=1 Tax=Endozoicomonas arenosclerae TaxID=1633495 RepID=UPI001FDF8FE0|nr:exodeoxyribonuclease VII large subunit [Endozoicomonas arenosclerae]
MQTDNQRPLTVTELNSRTRRMLETQFGNVRVEGEISGLARPGSGHWYFTLKDAGAQIRCAMFKNRNRSIRFVPAEGMQLIVRGRVSLYEGRGDYQLIVDHMEEGGAGALQRAFEELKLKLSNEGLFSAERKRPLPTLPSHIGVVTSPTGAAIRDILAVLKRRFPSIPVTVIPSAVQGKDAADELVRGIAAANRSGLFDILIVGRGGGSLEDLWPFNEEKVARAIAASDVPIVSAVGHEIDFTIADFVADYRAPTPSAAAEVLSPDQQEILNKLSLLNRKLQTLMKHRLQVLSQTLDNTSLRLRHPGERLREHYQRLDDLEIRLQQSMTIALQANTASYERLNDRLAQSSPARRIERMQGQLNLLQNKLNSNIQLLVKQKESHLKQLTGMLDAVSPLATLSRGYSIVAKGDEFIRDASQLNEGDQVTARFSKGSADCQVIQIYKD